MSDRQFARGTVRLSTDFRPRIRVVPTPEQARVTARLANISSSRFPLRVESACDSWHAHVQDAAGKAVTARQPGCPAWELQPVVVRENERRGHPESPAYPREVRLGGDEEFNAGGSHD